MTSDDGSGGPKRPRSVRDGLPGKPRPVRPDSDPERPERPERSGRSGRPTPARPDPGRPTPVRHAMEADGVTLDRSDFPSTTVELEGEEWTVRVEGRGRSGQPPDAGAPLLFLTFSRSAEPGERVREVLCVAPSLADLGPARLADLFGASRPYTPKEEPEGIFPGTRRGRKRR